MEIQSEDYAGKDRRTNGRLRLTTSNWITIILIVATVGAGLVRAEMTIKANSKAVKEVKETPIKVAVLQTCMENLEEGFDEFKIEQKTMNGELKGDIDELKTEQKVMVKDMNIGFKEVLAEIRNNR